MCGGLVACQGTKFTQDNQFLAGYSRWLQLGFTDSWLLQVVEVAGSEDQQQGDGCDGDFAESADDKGASTLLEEVFQVGAEAYSGEG